MLAAQHLRQLTAVFAGGSLVGHALVRSRVTVSGSSMNPTFDGSSETPTKLLLNHAGGALRLWGRGDVVAMTAPGDEADFVVKRVIGCAGDTVIARSGEEVVVPAQHIWVGECQARAARPALPLCATPYTYAGTVILLTT